MCITRVKYWLQEKKWAFEVEGGEVFMMIMGIIAIAIFALIIRWLAHNVGGGVAAIIAMAILLWIVWSESR